MTSEQRRILEFAAQHYAIVPWQVTMLLETHDEHASTRLLDVLATDGLIYHHHTHHRHHGYYQITGRGLRAIDSPLPEPRFETIRDLTELLGLPGLTLAARRGEMGTIHRAVTQRLMRHHDHALRSQPQPAPDAEPAYGVPLSTGIDRTVARRYPDLMLIVEQGRVAIELRTLHALPKQTAVHISGYAADPNILLVIYLVTDRPHGDEIIRVADRLGLHDDVRVQPVKTTEPAMFAAQ